ncbi:MAG TPA: 4-hydroxythreonine-4-phosphate dehydrogenase PdxA [Gemmatimonadales bacterium]|nr:4-hydroxythreonine-4-phosphate dehydrogenase PdxA [Gemmatimonadales bacterium]
MPRRPRLAVTLGDPRGIGPEVVAKALALGPLDADLVILGSGEQGAVPSDAAAGTAPRPLLPEEAGRLAGQAVEQAVQLARAGKVDAIVTGPVHKQALHLAGIEYPGLTEFLGHLAGDVEVAMMLATGPLRVVLVTTHIPLREVPAQVTTERVVCCGRIAERALRDWWGIASPRLAVCALNPHAGESGLFGDEDERVLAPAARTLGAAGPVPADTVFVRALRGEFDAVITPYHDVGMTAVKVAGFGKGVNVTLGLPFPRVAPDHGTAFDIAGHGVADPSSMRAALELAVDLGARLRSVRA